MSVKACELVWSHSRMDGAARLVMLAIADSVNGKDDGWCHPTVRRIAERAHLSERAVRSAIAQAMAAGELEVEHTPGRRSRYRLALDPCTDCTPAESAPLQDLHPCTDCTPAGFAPTPEQIAGPPTVGPELNRKEQGETTTVASPRKRTPRDDLWDALAAAVGYSPKGQEGALWGKLVSELVAVEATPEQVAAAGRLYQRDMPGATLTAPALVKHFNRLVQQAGRGNGRRRFSAGEMREAMDDAIRRGGGAPADAAGGVRQAARTGDDRAIPRPPGPLRGLAGGGDGSRRRDPGGAVLPFAGGDQRGIQRGASPPAPAGGGGAARHGDGAAASGVPRDARPASPRDADAVALSENPALTLVSRETL